MGLNKRLVIILTGFIALIAIAAWLIAKPNHHQTSPKSPEQGAVSEVIALLNTQSLYDVLLQKQFLVVRQAIITYIPKKIGASVKSAEIVQDSTKVNNDGSIEFQVKTDNPQKTFRVVLTRPTPSVVVFTVPEDQEEGKVLYPYGLPTP